MATGLGALVALCVASVAFGSWCLHHASGTVPKLVDREINVRKLIAAKAEKVAGEIATEAKKIGASDETIKKWRDKVLGVTAK